MAERSQRDSKAIGAAVTSRHIKYRLKSVDLNITKRCNLTCGFCSVNVERMSSKSPELTLQQIDNLFAQFDKMNVRRVRLVGGEPFVRQDINAILKSTSCFSFDTSVLTNATLIKPSHVEQLAESGIATVAVSVDGHTPELHDGSRNQPRVFERMLSTLQLCREAKLPLHMMTVVTSRNLRHLKDLVVFAEHHSFDVLNFIILGFNGRAVANRQNIPTFGSWSEEIVSLTNFIRDTNPGVYISLLFPHEDAVPVELHAPLTAAGLEDLVEEVWGFSPPSRRAKVTSGLSLCKAGHDGIAIMPNGDVYGCDLMQDMTEFRAGNIHTSTLSDIFHSSPVFTWMRANSHVSACAQFDQDSTNYACGQCRAGVRNLQRDARAL